MFAWHEVQTTVSPDRDHDSSQRPILAELRPLDVVDAITDSEGWKGAAALLAGENRLLQMLAEGHALGSILGGLCRMVEGLFGGSFVSIMLLNPHDNRLWYAASGSLPAAYTTALNGVAVGPSEGSCGTAAYRNAPVIVPDIATDPLWVRYRDVAALYGLRACWSTPIRSSAGHVLGTFAILSAQPGSPGADHRRAIEEVTHLASVAIARTRADEELRRSAAYQAQAQELSRTGSFGWDVSSGAVFWSNETFSILGYAPDMKPTLELVLARVHPEDLPSVEQAVARAARDGADLDLEPRLLFRDGAVKHLRVLAHAVQNDAGTLEFIGAVSDVTPAKLAEAAIRRSEAELRQIVDAIPQLIVAMSPGGKILYANESVLQSTGLGKDDVMADDFRTRLFHPDDVARVRHQRQHGFEHGLPFESEMRARLKDGLYRWFLVYYKPVRDEHGGVVRWYAIGTDIDDRKRAEDRIRNENVALREEIDRASMFEEIVGSSEALQKVLREIGQVAPTDSTVLITGETGTGKELVARAIHRRSARSSQAFVSINCAAVPTSLIASELFGHERGAFTGALERRQGKFELAEGGTIFLDEVGELPSETQLLLLRVLQEREFQRLGANRPIHSDVRVIAATNLDLSAAVAAQTFRADLFYRLHVFPIEVPALRDRRSDISLLVAYLVHRYARRAGKHVNTVSRRTLDLLEAYPWPGNIRELQNVIERAVIISDTETLSVDERWLVQRPAAPLGAKAALSADLIAHERARVEAALTESHGRVSGPSGAAARLGIPRSTLESKIRSLKLNKHRFKVNPS